MKTITFLRHAEPDNAGNLSPHGIFQATQRALDFSKKPPDLIITSSASRAIQTGVCIQETLNLNIPQKSLVELSIPESIDAQFLQKAKAAFEQTIKDHNAENILVISHSGLINEFGQSIAFFDILETTRFGCAEGFQIHWEDKKPFLTLLK